MAAAGLPWNGGAQAMTRLTPGHLRGEDGHVGGGEQRILAAGHVAADAVHRDVPVAQDHPGQGLDFDVLQRVLLDLREIADLRLRELDVVDLARRHGLDAGLDLRRAQLEGGRVPVVELARVLAHRLVAALLDVGQDGLHGLAHLGDVGGILLGADAGLEIADHACSLWLPARWPALGSMALIIGPEKLRPGGAPAPATPDAIVARPNTKSPTGRILDEHSPLQHRTCLLRTTRGRRSGRHACSPRPDRSAALSAIGPGRGPELHLGLALAAAVVQPALRGRLGQQPPADQGLDSPDRLRRGHDVLQRPARRADHRRPGPHQPRRQDVRRAERRGERRAQRADGAGHRDLPQGQVRQSRRAARRGEVQGDGHAGAGLRDHRRRPGSHRQGAGGRSAGGRLGADPHRLRQAVRRQGQVHGPASRAG